MSLRTLTYPEFDFLELTEAPEPTPLSFEKLTPVQNGTVVPEFNAAHNHERWHRFFDEIAFDGYASNFSYSHKPLLLYFFEDEWGSLSRGHLRQLNSLQNELRHYNVNVLVITSQSLLQFRNYAWSDGLSLDVYEDVNNELAGLFKLHSHRSPAWNRYAGVDGNPALPGLYLLGKTRQVALAYPNEELEEKLPADNVLKAATANIWDSRKRSA